MASFFWSLAASSAASLPSGACAQALSISIAAGPLAQSIRALSEQSGISIGFRGRLPDIGAHPVRRARSGADALRQLLEGTGYRAIRTGPASFRIEPALIARSLAKPVPKPPRQEPAAAEIIVTARKRAEPLSALPGTDRVLAGEQLQSALGLAQTEVVARELPSLSLSSMGPGRNRLFIRGIGDGPLDGFNQGSVAVFLDEARLNYDAPDPDWALVDIHQVEVLEGPQGPLYGTGSLGGIVKIATNRPDLVQHSGSITAGVALAEDGDLSDNESAILNAVVAPRFALRAVAYRQREAGWIDNFGARYDSNDERLIGGRLGLTWSSAQRLTIDLTVALQTRRTSDSQYVDGNLGPLERPNRLQEVRDLDAELVVLTAKRPIGSLDLTSTTSLSRQEAVASYDATPLASQLGTKSPVLVSDARRYSLFDQEIRIESDHAETVDWLAGLSLMGASTKASIVANDSASSSPLMTLKRSVTEAAAYAQASLAMSSVLTLAAGARLFSSAVDDEGREGNSQSMSGQHDVRLSEDASLTWRPNRRTTIYLRGATAYRPGGINVEPSATQSTYQADQLASIELGTRFELGRAVSLDSTLYAARWQHVQADELLANGLVSIRNAGNARNIGAEGDARVTLAPGLVLTGAMIVQSARLEGARARGIDDPRLPAVPQAAARVRLDRSFRLGPWSGNAELGVRFSGATHLSFDRVLDRRTRAHGTIDALASLSRNRWTASLSGENLTDSSADTFAFGNPYRVRSAPERTPLRPRTIALVVSRSF